MNWEKERTKAANNRKKRNKTERKKCVLSGSCVSYYLTRDSTVFLKIHFFVVVAVVVIQLRRLPTPSLYCLTYFFIFIFQQKFGFGWRPVGGILMNTRTRWAEPAWWDLRPCFFFFRIYFLGKFFCFLYVSTTPRHSKYKCGTCTTFTGTEPMRAGCSLVRKFFFFFSF
jgi:hypothetical protein